VVLNYHSGEAEDHLRRWRTARLARRFDRIVVPSAYLQRVFASFGLDALAIHNFVNTESIPYRERQTPRPRFLSNRNLEPMYNVACSIRAFARIQSNIPEAELVVAGYGSQRAPLEALVAQLALRNVKFTGRVTQAEMARMLHEADILLNSPDIDNMPLSVLEAQAAGVAIVSTNTGGIPFIVENGVTGLLVNPRDDAGLAESAMRLLREPGLASGITRQAYEVCMASYSWNAVRQQWIECYRDLVASPAQHD
jgi:glycosyltransferase involved in cell wall biosynthesis